MQQDQNLGAVLMFAATILYVGRHSLVWCCGRCSAGRTADEAQGRYLPYAAGWLGLCAVRGGHGGVADGGRDDVHRRSGPVGMGGMLYPGDRPRCGRDRPDVRPAFDAACTAVDHHWPSRLPEGMAVKTSAEFVLHGGLAQRDLRARPARVALPASCRRRCAWPMAQRTSRRRHGVESCPSPLPARWRWVSGTWSPARACSTPSTHYGATAGPQAGLTAQPYAVEASR